MTGSNTYEFHQVENEKPLTAANFVSREQFDTLNDKIDQLMAQLSAQAQPTAGSNQGRNKNG